MTDIAKTRTIAFIAHGGSGKTSLCEAILYFTKVTTRQGSVDDGTSILDFEPEEVKRNISISAAFPFLPLAETRSALCRHPRRRELPQRHQNHPAGRGRRRGADRFPLTASRVSTEKVWAFADEYELPRLALINKMDRERADFFKCVGELNDIFGTPCLPIQVPIGAEASFSPAWSIC